MLAVVTIAALAALTVVTVTTATEYHSNPWLLSWIPAYCCVTNDCCWEVAERDLASLSDDKWQVVATGQVRERTNWSPDGKFYRCACDYDRPPASGSGTSALIRGACLCRCARAA
jgi:hypothetical protein